MLCVSNLSLQYGGKILFRHVSFQLMPKKRCGLVGANGAGKTSLLRLLLGEESAGSGTITVAKTARIATLSQDHYVYENEHLINVVLQGNSALYQALKRKQELLDKERFTDSECSELEQLETLLHQHSAYAAEAKAAHLLAGLGLKPESHFAPMRLLSGGYRLRVLLAKVLFAKPDILLLDEPTNHLDIVSIRWLEHYLQSFPGVVVVSSHERTFLSRVCNCIADVDYATIRFYPFGYEAFLNAKQTYRSQQEKRLANEQKKRDEMQGFVDRFRAKASKARQAQSRVRMIEKLEEQMSAFALTPSSRKYPRFVFSQERPSGLVPIRAEGICKSFGKTPILRDVSFHLERGKRIALIGPNGVGKSTLLKILANDLQADQGKIHFGHATCFSYFAQNHEQVLQGGGTVFEWLRSAVPERADQELRDALGRSLFSGQETEKPLKALSGGEKARLVLSKMMLEKSNLLLLDEPTNHLDMEAIEVLLQALYSYPGTVLFVSHNAYFVSSLAERILEITSCGIRSFLGNYQEYLQTYEQDYLGSMAALSGLQRAKPDSKGAASHEERRRMRNEKKQIKQRIAELEDCCQELETELTGLDAAMAENGFYEQEKALIQKMATRRKMLDEELTQTLVCWEELHDQLDELERVVNL